MIKPKTKIPSFSHTAKYRKNHLLILEVFNRPFYSKSRTKPTQHEINKVTGLSYRTISSHMKEIRECYNCRSFNNKVVFCKKCGIRLVNSYG